MIAVGHSVRQTDGRTYAVVESPEAAKDLVALFDVLPEVYRFIDACGYGGRNRAAERDHARKLEKFLASIGAKP